MAQTDYSLEMDRGIAGSLQKGRPSHVVTARNDETVLETPFGFAVQRGSTTDKTSALVTDDITDSILGLVVYTGSYDDTQLGDDGPLPGETLSIAKSGTMLVVCENGCSPGDRLFVRSVDGDLGALRSAADSTDTIDTLQHAGEWNDEAAAGALALLTFDFTRIP